MKQCFALLLCSLVLFSSSALRAEETADPKKETPPAAGINGLDFYEKNYFICGQGDTSAKWQLSFKYSIFYPSAVGMYFSYTQTCRWDLFNKPSSPFRDTNFSPSGFYSLDSKNNIFWNADLYAIDFLQFGVRHKSNGKDGADSRAINYWYCSGQMSTGTFINLGLYGKYMFQFFGMDETNRDIRTYMGNFETRVFAKVENESAVWFDREEIYVAYGAKNLKRKSLEHYGWIEVGAQIRLLTSYVRPMLYVQLWRGYGENMLEYNKKDTCLRAGVTFN